MLIRISTRVRSEKMGTRHALAAKLSNSTPVVKEAFIQEACRGKSVLDLGCIRHNADFASNDPNWLHKIIKAVAKRVVGVDYLPEEIKKLNAMGYDIIWGDVTKPMAIQETFDVIVAGDLIEHLANFEGFFENCSLLLKPDGVLIITTPNPFFAGEFHYTAFKKMFLINPEHTCWIDPQALSQLAGRFGYAIKDAYFIKHSWQLRNLITESEQNEYDILQGTWLNNSIGYKMFRLVAGIFFNIVYTPYKFISGANTALVRYSDYLAILSKRDQ
jgi:2-polyprenyl-3-methyl-5-hydroxy-6-metoxy-1,4-benzoquinol methylase